MLHGQLSDEVAVGGGGSSTYSPLRGLQGVFGENLLTSIHTMSDSGGSSRRLRDEFGRTLPMGDLRQGSVAQSRNRRLWRDLFAYRFTANPVAIGLGGHSLGNLILHALEKINDGRVMEAIADAEYMLNTGGHGARIGLRAPGRLFPASGGNPRWPNPTATVETILTIDPTIGAFRARRQAPRTSEPPLAVPYSDINIPVQIVPPVATP